jgi:predicted ATPase
MREDLPQGEVTLLFTDVEGSTQLLHDVGPDRYAELLAEHRRLLRAAFMRGGGVEVDTQGDAFFVSFPSAQAAVAAAAAAQAALSNGSVRVRMGLHTGTPHLTDEGYVGKDVHLGSRIASAGHGGQVLLSAATRSLVEADTTDLGEHRLKDFADPVPIFQLGSERYAPLKTISNTNLPRPASSFVGRDREIAELVALLRGEDRIVTLTGPGGSGKTRLAIEGATEVIGDFKAGVFWVGLAPLRDSALVLEEIGRTLGAKGDLVSHVAERQMLLLLDNFEHVVDAAPSLSSLLRMCPNLRLLVTSRALLRIDGESEFPVLPLEHSEAVALFAARARVDEDAAIAELCRRLDNLPLAVELAAARVRVLAPAEILERLGQRLDLLKGGRDADPRQQTLRATIAWSHDLLAEEERRLFARLSVFAGGCTLETAELLVDADVDTLQSLVEKSLVRQTAGRFWMLETIREYAAEQLLEPGLVRAFAEHYLVFAQAADVELRARPETWLDRLDAEHDNLRAALDHFSSTAQSQKALALAAALARFWTMRGHFREGRARLEELLARDETPTAARAGALNGAVALVLGQADTVAAERYGGEALTIHRNLGDEHGVAFSLYQLGAVAGETEDFELAMRLTAESVDLLRRLGDDFLACQALLNLGYDHQCVGDFVGGQLLLEQALEEARAAGNAAQQARALGQLAVGARDQGRHTEALPLLGESVEIWGRVGDPAMFARELRRVAYSLAKLGRAEPAAQLLAASEAAREGAGHFEAWIPRINDEILGDLHAQLAPDAFDDAWRTGQKLTVDEAVELTRSVVGLGLSGIDDDPKRG